MNDRKVTFPHWVDVAQWAMVAGMVALGAIAWPRMPDSAPVHWNAAGEVDRYGGRWEALVVLPAIAAILVVLLRFLSEVDPRRARYAEFMGAYSAVRLAVVTGLAAIYAVTVQQALGGQVSVALGVSVVVGLLLGVVGWTLDRTRPSWFFGIRTPWTLSSERAWIATHRAGKWLSLFMGAAVVVAGLVGRDWAVFMAAFTCIGGAAGLVVYSFIVWRSDPTTKRTVHG